MSDSIPDLIHAGRFKPQNSLIIARIDKVQQVGSLILPTGAQFETSTATIVALGADLPEYLKLGLRVLPHESTGRAIYDDDNTRYVAYELSDLQAVFTEDATKEEIEEYFLDHAGKTQRRRK